MLTQDPESIKIPDPEFFLDPGSPTPDVSMNPENGSLDLIPSIWIPDPFRS